MRPGFLHKGYTKVWLHQNRLNLKRIALLGFLMSIQLVWLKSLPYASSLLVNTSPVGSLDRPSEDFSIGGVRWDVSQYVKDSRLAPLRDYFYEKCPGKKGIAAAITLSEEFAKTFSMGQGSTEFFDRGYDPVKDLQSHINGEPGHCVTRSALISAILLSAGIPARVVQLIPNSGPGHNVFEVWDEKFGWVLIDPTMGGLVAKDKAPTSAINAMDSPNSVNWIEHTEIANLIGNNPHEYYERQSSPFANGHIIYPEPWLYMRTGHRDSYWPFRGKFLHIGERQWKYGVGQSLLHYGILGCFSLMSVFALMIVANTSRRILKAEAHHSKNQIAMVDDPHSAQNLGDLSKLIEELRCPNCQGNLTSAHQDTEFELRDCLRCSRCLVAFPVINGIPRMVMPSVHNRLIAEENVSGRDDTKIATARSFGFEWTQFPEVYREWERNFLNYMSPRTPEFFQGKRILDAGCGSGRHALYAGAYGADVWAVDLGKAVEIAKGNTANTGTVRVVQADLSNLPFAGESFDFIYSIGVLHHLQDPETVLQNLIRYLKPGGEIAIYLYWKPENQPIKRILLSLVTTMRRLTTSLPHNVIYALSYPAAWTAYALFVWPYQLLNRIPALQNLAQHIPMKQYSSYPFRVCVNDQFDRFSAPIEKRYTKAEVENWLRHAGLEEVDVRANYGWLGTGRKPARARAENRVRQEVLSADY